ncbi:MAG: ABC-F family ATP-binding cassette domain-containing protein [Polyangiaceae bacterium]|nr:ABC-F family ATP-binding cassette domain-containing protein [Polyangiaceae bacterium]
MISVSQLAKGYGARVLFEEVNLKLTPGCRYGLVGANGSGKTTFLNILAGGEAPTHGSVAIPRTARMGILRQDRFLRDEDPILDVASQGDELVWNALQEQKRLVEHGEDPARIAELEDVIRTHDGYTLESRASFVLEGLGIPVAQHRMPLATLSGGFKLRVLLAQVLLGGPDVVLLDEPTNHLDILSIRWLEKFMAAYSGCAVIISHDQRFLDNVVTHILDVDYETITSYVGNYSAFVREKQAILERKEAEIEKAETEIAHKRAFVERFRYKASKASQAQSRLKQIEKIEVEELAQSSRRAPRFLFEPERQSGRDVLSAEHIFKSYGDKVVLRDASIVVRRGERVAIIGPNGLGKSTLLRILVNRLDADAGDVVWGHEVRIGYFAQDHREVLTNGEATVLDTLWAVRPREGNAFVRGHLGRVLFSGDDVHKRVGMLSGGEAARLVFACIAAAEPNVLVLDEPTNHLDLEAIAGLTEALSKFTGTILFVSHDRWFVSQLATRIFEITPQGPRDFPGTYNEYLERCGDDHLDVDAVVLKAKKEKQKDAPSAAPEKEASWEDQKKRRNRQKELPARRDKVLIQIEKAEARKKQITDLYASEGFFERTSQADVNALVAEEKILAEQIDAMVLEWEALETEIAELPTM